MTLTVKHTFVSAKGDGSDATLVRPSNWNANHDMDMATNRVLGRLTAGPGDVEELPVTSYMMSLLNTADFAALAVLLGLPTTGDAKLTFKSAADAGWVLANDGSIGDAVSGGTTRAHADTQALFTFFFDGFSDAVAPIQTSAGAATTRVAQGAAATAYSAHCRIVLPKQLGRALVVGGTGSGLSARALGTTGGFETHQLLAAELPAHTHTVTPTGTNAAANLAHTHTETGTFTSTSAGPDHTHAQLGTMTAASAGGAHAHNYDKLTGLGAGGGGPFGWASQTATATTSTDISHTHSVAMSGSTGTATAFSHTHNITLSGETASALTTHGHVFTGDLNTTSSIGGGGVHNNMQPWTAWNIML
jgi:microcystin-dependent protein